jgi:hypothetical protein
VDTSSVITPPPSVDHVGGRHQLPRQLPGLPAGEAVLPRIPQVHRGLLDAAVGVLHRAGPHVGVVAIDAAVIGGDHSARRRGSGLPVVGPIDTGGQSGSGFGDHHRHAWGFLPGDLPDCADPNSTPHAPQAVKQQVNVQYTVPDNPENTLRAKLLDGAKPATPHDRGKFTATNIAPGNVFWWPAPLRG